MILPKSANILASILTLYIISSANNKSKGDLISNESFTIDPRDISIFDSFSCTLISVTLISCSGIENNGLDSIEYEILIGSSCLVMIVTRLVERGHEEISDCSGSGMNRVGDIRMIIF